MKEKAARLKKDIPAIFLALRHPSTPVIAKLLAALTVAYALSPIDLIPDFIPVLGYLDDLILLPLLVALTVKLIPESVMAECRSRSEGMWSAGKPKRWVFGLPVLLIWLLLIGLAIRVILSFTRPN